MQELQTIQYSFVFAQEKKLPKNWRAGSRKNESSYLSQGLVRYGLWVKSSSSKSAFNKTQSFFICLCMSMTAFTLQQQRWLTVTETLGLQNLKYLHLTLYGKNKPKPRFIC